MASEKEYNMRGCASEIEKEKKTARAETPSSRFIHNNTI